MANKELKLGFILHGVGPGWGDWRHPDADPSASTNFAFYKRQAKAAEAGKFDFLFVADSVFVTAKSSPFANGCPSRCSCRAPHASPVE